MSIDSTFPPGLRRRDLIGLLALPSTPSMARPATLDQALHALVNDRQCPLTGLSVLVRRNGRVVYEAQFGWRHVGPDLPVTRDTIFRMASVTKLVVAIGVMRLADAGKLDLDANLDELLGHRLFKSLCLRHLLSHRSGLTDRGTDYTDPAVDLRQLLSQSGPTWNGHEPGSWFEYANINFAVVAAAMERATGSRFDQLMQRLVLDPLSMQGGFDPASLPVKQLSQVATLYRKAPDDDGPWDTAGPWVPQADDFLVTPPRPVLEDSAGYVPGSRGAAFGPQGRLRTRVADLGTLLAVLVDGGNYRGQTFLKPESLRTLMSETWRSDGNNGDDGAGIFQAWGVGMQHFIDRGREGWGDRLLHNGGLHAWGHLGFAYGLVSAFLMVPERQCGIVYAISGTGANPSMHPGQRSSFPAWEEQLQDLLWNEALRG
ncbi:serine hydrolase domain-containing protein [Paucibacter sp. JuS9]|uniref:serine hydrolase domain-containing protein n=1 Tax=Roseateles TaxID=93681 RepID=UPI002FE62692